MATNFLIDGNVVDQINVPVVGATVYIYDLNGLAEIFDEVGQAIKQPLTTGEDGYWSAYVPDQRLYTIKYYWGGRLRLTDANRYVGSIPLAVESSAAARDAATESKSARDTALTYRNETQDALDAAKDAKDTAVSARNDAFAAIEAGVHPFYPGARSNVPQGATGTGAITGGSGGTDGTFALAFTGGNFDVNPTGTFTVSGGAVTAITITGPGLYIGGSITAPTLDFSVSAGLTGADAALTTGFLVPSGDFYYTDHASDAGQYAQFQNVTGTATEVDASVDRLNIGLARSYAEQVNENLALLSTAITVGRDEDTATTGTTGVAGRYVYQAPVTIPAGHVAQIVKAWIYNPAGVTRTVRIGSWSKSGDDFTEQAASSQTAAAASYAEWDGLTIAIADGERVGFEVQTDGIAYTTSSDDDGGYYYGSGTGTTFTDTAATSGVQLQFGALVRYVSVSETRLAAAEASITQAENVESKLEASFATETVAAAANAQVGVFGATFSRYAVGADTGNQIEANRPYSSVTINLARKTGTETFRLNVYERLTASGTVNDNITAADVPVKTVTVDATGYTVDAYNDVTFALDGYQADAGTTVIFDVTGLNSSAAPSGIDIGKGQANLTQQRYRGWYASNTTAATVATNATIGSTASVAWTVNEDRYAVSGNSTAARVDLLAAGYFDLSVSTMAVTVSGEYRKNGTNYPASGTLNLTAAAAGKERVDLIVLDRATLTISAVAGTERDENLDALEWQAAVPSDKFLIGRVLVDDTEAKVADASDFRDLIKVGGEAEMTAHIERNRRLLRSLIAKATRGDTIKLGGYGDSLTALQDTTIIPAAPARYDANGVWRDRRDYYFQNYPTDTKNLIPVYDFGDGAGTVHTKLGWNWSIKEALDDLAGSEVVTYLNYGLGSTTSQATTGNGLDATRIAVPLTAGLDAVVIAFGMNERGQTYTYANTVNMIGQFKAAGVIPIIMGVPRPNAAESVAAWRYTNQALEAAALDEDCPYISTLAIADDANLGGIGLPAEALASTNIGSGNNHPGFFELGRYEKAAVIQLGLS